MKLVEVDVVGLQPAQRRFAGAADAIRRRIRAGDLPGCLVKDGIELGGDHHLLALSSQRLAQDSFAMPGAVDIRRIKKGGAQIDRAVNGAARRVIHWPQPFGCYGNEQIA